MNNLSPKQEARYILLDAQAKIVNLPRFAGQVQVYRGINRILGLSIMKD